MCILKDLVVYLLTLPQDADVRVLNTFGDRGQWTEHTELEVGKNVHYYDAINVLQLGE